MTLIQVKPQQNDTLAIKINEAEMQYDKGFGRRYTYAAGISLLKSSLAATEAMIDLLPQYDNHAANYLLNKKEEDAAACRREFKQIMKCSKIMAVGIALGIAKLFASIIADPIKLALEAIERRRHPEGRTAILVIDAQKDFTQPGKQVVDGIEHEYGVGGLGVSGGYEIVPKINEMMRRLAPGNVVAASLDWHPEGHKSFASSTPGTKPFDVIELVDTEQVMWPDHCVQGSKGAELLQGLDQSKIQYTVRKGLQLFVDSYSAFFDNGNKNQTALHEYLEGRNVKRVLVTGIATDYCVKFTALDAKDLGYDVTVVLDACRGVNMNDSVAAAVAELKQKGVKVMTSEEVMQSNDFMAQPVPSLLDKVKVAFSTYFPVRA